MFRMLRQLLLTICVLFIFFTVIVTLAVWYFAPEWYSWFWALCTGAISEWFFDPNNAFTLTLRIGLGVLAIVMVWAIAINVLRPRFVIPARLFGFYDMARFHAILKFSPPWRPVYRVLLPFLLWWRNRGFGRRPASRPAGLIETMASVYEPGDMPVGRFAPFGIPAFQPVSVKGERHMCIVAAPGSGKTVHIISIISQEKGNVLVFDVDGQIIHALGHNLEAEGKEVVKLDPFNLAPKFPGGSINFIDEFAAAEKRHGRDAIVAFAKVLADALIQVYDRRNEWVYNQARAFMQGLLLYVYLYELPERRNMVRVRELLTLGLREKARPQDDPWLVLLADMSLKRDDFGGVIAKAASVMLSSQSKDDKNQPRTSAIEQTSWLDLPEMIAISQRSDFHCEDLKMGNICLFINAPLTDIQKQLSGWCRVLAEMTMYAFQRITDYRPVHPTLFVAEELPSLGRLEVLETAIPGFRKFGLKVIAVMQNLEKLQAVYPQTWGTFLGDAGCVIWMKTAHTQTLEYLGKKLGRITFTERVKGGWFFRKKENLQQKDREVKPASELEEFLDQNIIVTRANQRPFFLKPLHYWEELPVWSYQPDRFYGETPRRAWMRTFIARWRPWIKQKADALNKRAEEELDGRIGETLGTLGICWFSGIYIQMLFKPAKHQFELVIQRTLGVIAVVVFTCMLLFLLGRNLVDAYRTIVARLNKTFSGQHPYKASTTLFFGCLFVIAAGGLGVIKAVSVYEKPLASSGIIVGVLYAAVMVILCLLEFCIIVCTAPFIGPLLYGFFLVVLFPGIYTIRAFKRVYNRLADKAMWHTLCATKYVPKRQKSIIRWLAERYPERYQRAVLKARRVAEAQHLLRQRPLA